MPGATGPTAAAYAPSSLRYCGVLIGVGALLHPRQATARDVEGDRLGVAIRLVADLEGVDAAGRQGRDRGLREARGVGRVGEAEVQPEDQRRAGRPLPVAQLGEPVGRDVGGDRHRARRPGRVPPRLVGRVAAEAQRRRAVPAGSEGPDQAGEDLVDLAARADVVGHRPVLDRHPRERRRDRRAGPRRRDPAIDDRARARLGRRPDDRRWRRLGGDHRVADRPVVGDVAIGRVGDQRGAQRPVAVLAGRDVGHGLPRGPGARDADLDLDGVDAAGPDLPPQRAAREVQPHRVGEVRQRGLGPAVGVVQARLPAGVALAAADRLVDPQVLREQLDARIAPRQVRRLLQIEVLAAGRHAPQLVGRVGLEAVLVEPDAQRRRCCPGSGPTAA